MVELIANGYEPVVLDNLSNPSEKSLQRVSQITGKQISFIQGDIRDVETLNNVFSKYTFKAVIHFAGLKAVGESVDNPIMKIMCMEVCSYLK